MRNERNHALTAWAGEVKGYRADLDRLAERERVLREALAANLNECLYPTAEWREIIVSIRDRSRAALEATNEA
jgi:hypothetical protein